MTKQDKNDSGKTKSKTSQFLKGPLLSVCFLPSPTVSSQKHTHIQYKKGKNENTNDTYMKLVLQTCKSSTRRERGTATRRERGTATRRDRGTATSPSSSSSSSTEMPAKITQLILFIYCHIWAKTVQLHRLRNTAELCLPKSRPLTTSPTHN